MTSATPRNTDSSRDIYYRDPELFIKQAVVDRYVDDIAFTLDVPRQALNVAATAKGLFNGVLRGQKHDGQFIVYSAGNEVMARCSFTHCPPLTVNRTHSYAT